MDKSQVQCKLSTNEKLQSIVPECSRPIAIVPKTWGGFLFSDGSQQLIIFMDFSTVGGWGTPSVKIFPDINQQKFAFEKRHFEN